MWDFVIVGGGSAGCVLANRLSAKPERTVLLIEAGRDVKPGEEGSAILDTYPGRAAFDPRNHWDGLMAYTQPHQHNVPHRSPAKRYEQPRLIGGGSSINGQVATRGLPVDYDEWASLGAEGWDWDGVLPYFIRLERDLDYSGPLHGRDGPMPICRIPRERWPELSLAAERALTEIGYPAIGDSNAVFNDGHFPIPLANNRGEHRVSTAMAYLDAKTRARPNLTVLADAQVTTVALEGRRVTGVRAVREREEQFFPAREVVVSSGAIHSPAVLMRSGVGPALDLKKIGIEPVIDLPGVGANLQEHPGISLSAYIRPGARLKHTRRHIHLALRYSSEVEGCGPSDMFAMLAAKSAWHPLGIRIATMISWVNKAESRGTVELVSADPSRSPMVNLNYMADVRDLERLKAAVRLMARVFASRSLAEYIEQPGPSSYSGFAKSLGRQTVKNYLLTAPVALLIDALPPVRREFFRRAVASGLTLEALLTNEDALESYIRSNAFGQWHVCGTCRMGSSHDREAVVSPITGQVHGIEGLRVADASVMPTAPRANLNIPVVMVAERMSDLISASA